MLDIQIADQQTRHPVDAERLREGVRRVLEREGVRRATISVAVVDDSTIHDLNRRYLDHDYPTDVLSFPLDNEPGYVEGEIVVSADMAAATGPEHQLSAADELLLYVVHGALHLVGYGDKHEPQRRAMRAMERVHLEACGVRLPPQNEWPSRESASSSGQATRSDT